MSYCIHRYTIPCTMKQSKSDICTLTTFTAQNHVLKIALIGIAVLLIVILGRERILDQLDWTTSCWASEVFP